jgi:hypothetical protein
MEKEKFGELLSKTRLNNFLMFLKETPKGSALIFCE